MMDVADVLCYCTVYSRCLTLVRGVIRQLLPLSLSHQKLSALKVYALELPNDYLALRRWRTPCISFVIPLYFQWNPFMNTKEIQGTRCMRKTKLSLGSSRETKNQSKHFRFLP